MTWRTLLLAVALIGTAAMVGAQEHRDQAAPEKKDGTAASTGVGGMMSCPMMSAHASRTSGMHAMASPGERPAMGAGMDRPAMGMGMMEMAPMPGPGADPKTQGRWMQIRGEMMKAMGDILMRHGRDLESGK